MADEPQSQPTVSPPSLPNLYALAVDWAFHQSPALLVALGTVALLAGWVPSPVLSKVEDVIAKVEGMKDDHWLIVKKLTAICVNAAGVDETKLHRCLE